MLNILPKYVSKWNSGSQNIENLVKVHWCILPSIVLFPFCLLVYIVLTIGNTLLDIFLDLYVGLINLRPFGAALTSSCSGVSEYSMQLSSSMLDSVSAPQLCSLSFELSQSTLQSCLFLASKMLLGAHFSSHSTGWWLIPSIQQTFNA